MRSVTPGSRLFGDAPKDPVGLRCANPTYVAIRDAPNGRTLASNGVTWSTWGISEDPVGLRCANPTYVTACLHDPPDRNFPRATSSENLLSELRPA